MSQTHLHAEAAPPKRNRLKEAAIIAALGVFGLLVAFGSYWEGCASGREFAEAKILDTRIAIVSMHESQQGSWAEYRIEARVTYNLHGQMRDRWIPVSELYRDRTWLEMRMAGHPKSCEVSWPKANPENARCRLPSN